MDLNKKIIFISILIIFLNFTGYSDKISLQRVAAVRVGLAAEPNNYAGSFPVTVKFKGKITAAKPGVVKYRYEWGDGNIGKLKTITFIKSGTKNVILSRVFKSPATGRGRIKILAPVILYSNMAAYSLKRKLILSKNAQRYKLDPKLRIKPKVHLKPKFTIKKLADWRKLAKAMMPDLVIQKFKSVGPAGYLGEVTRLEAEVANIGNVRSGKCELSVTMYVPENAPKTEDNCPGCIFTHRYDIPELDPGTVCIIEASWIFSTPGLWKFLAKADYKMYTPKGVVIEINEDNNKATTFVVMHN